MAAETPSLADLSLTDQEATDEPCTACSWTKFQQRTCSYKSELRLLYGVSHRGVWSLGSQYFLKDQESSTPDYDAQNTRFLQSRTTIPVPQTVLEWNEPGNKCVRIIKAIDGITLEKAWPKLSDTERHDIAKQTWGYLAQLRTLQSDQIESIYHGPIYNNFIFAGGSGSPHGPLKSDEEVFNEMAGGIKKLPEKTLETIRKRMPTSTPYTFTHGELSSSNIIIKDGKVTGILDWEQSGYMPVWWEYVSTHHSETTEDAEWKAVLRKCMDEEGHDEPYASWFHTECYHLRDYPELPPEGEEVLAEIERQIREEEASRGREVELGAE